MYELRVEKMTCPSCARIMKRALQSIDASVEVEVNLMTRRVKVRSTKSIEEVIAKIIEAGYPVLTESTIEQDRSIQE